MIKITNKRVFVDKNNLIMYKINNTAYVSCYLYEYKSELMNIRYTIKKDGLIISKTYHYSRIAPPSNGFLVRLTLFSYLNTNKY
jgi:hypothetical protein